MPHPEGRPGRWIPVALSLAVCVGAGPARLAAGARPMVGTWMELTAPSGAPADTVQVPGSWIHVDTTRTGADGTVHTRPYLVTGSVSVTTPEGDRVAFRVESASLGRLTPTPPFDRPGTRLVVRYASIPLGVRTEFRLNRRPIDVPESGSPTVRPSAPAPGSQPTLRRSGSISRGILAGSNRDVAVESGLRLDLAGEVAPGVQLRASLSDADVPIRPDGTTQRLSEFDRVFIELDAAPGTVQLGDVDVRFAGSRFAGFRRKLQGGWVDGGLGPVSVRAVGATSRGQFRSQTLTPLDGVQGPYRLEGSAGEPFILVVPGSERVFVDGRAIERGGAGYTIDYNTAEIVFADELPITSDRRLQVEFEYASNRFTRTVTGVETDLMLAGSSEGRYLSVGSTVIREADTGDFLAELGLSATDSLLLAGAGDGEAFRSGAVPVAYDPEAQYAQYEWAPGPDGDSIFVALTRIPAPDETVYRVQFTRVGDGAGRYARAGQGLNGIIYSYRGAGQGAYEPVRRLPRPTSHLMVDLRAETVPFDGLVIRTEWARSVLDRNRISSLDGEDDAGTASYVQVRFMPSDRLEAGYRFRRQSRDFAAFERLRDVEFAREWNLQAFDAPFGSIAGAGFEREQSADISWMPTDSVRLTAEAGRLDLAGMYVGERIRVGGASGGSLLAVRYAFDAVNAQFEGTQADGTWRRHDGGVTRASGAIRPYLDVEAETRRDALRDTLKATSLRFLEVRPGIRLSGRVGSIHVQAERRVEDWPSGIRFERAASAWSIRTGFRWRPTTAVRADGAVAWRARTFTEAFDGSPGAGDARTLLVTTDGGITHGPSSWTWSYDARSERTPTLQEIYIRTGPEQGGYVWQDANGDGAAQLDEFIPETTPGEGTYVRTWLPSDSLASVTAVRARVQYRFEPSGEGVLSGIRTATLMDVEERSRTGRRADLYLLRLGRFRTPGLTVNGRVRFRQEVGLLRGRPNMDLDIVYQDARSYSELAAGSERRLDRLGEVDGRLRITTGVDAHARFGRERRSTESERFASRRYDLRTWRFAPSLSVRLARNGSMRAGADMAWKSDASADRSAVVLRFPVSVRLVRAGRSDVLLRAEMADIRVSGTAAGLAAFELTDGRGDGRSWLWGFTWQASLTENLRATAGYDGRAPAEGPIVHTGRVQLSAVF